MHRTQSVAGATRTSSSLPPLDVHDDLQREVSVASSASPGHSPGHSPRGHGAGDSCDNLTLNFGGASSPFGPARTAMGAFYAAGTSPTAEPVATHPDNASGQRLVHTRVRRRSSGAGGAAAAAHVAAQLDALMGPLDMCEAAEAAQTEEAENDLQGLVCICTAGFTLLSCAVCWCFVQRYCSNMQRSHRNRAILQAVRFPGAFRQSSPGCSCPSSTQDLSSLEIKENCCADR